jgi:bacteriocin biosynthesis cyclodehydratase domain-containing protein
MKDEIKSFTDIEALLDSSQDIERIVAAFWRPSDELCASLNKLSYDHQVPFLPLVANGGQLIVGPLVIPGRSACWSCWSKRSKQHDVWLQYRSAVNEHYLRHPDAGPQSYLESAAFMGAAFISSTLTSLRLGLAQAGTIWQIDPVRAVITTGCVIGVHGCSLCGLQDRNANRTYIALQPFVESRRRWKQASDANDRT